MVDISKSSLCWMVLLIGLLWPIGVFGGGCHGAGFIPRQTDFEITSDLLEYSIVSTDLSRLSYEKGLTDDARRGELFGYDTFQVWRDIDNSDLALVASKNDVCYAAFRGTISWNVRDIVQVFSTSERSLGGCSVRRGFYSAYYTKYYDEFRAAIDECMARERSSPPQLIVTGQSQGGSTAIIAYLDLEEYNPIAITFGALRAVKGEDSNCADFSRLYRFATVGEGMYDAWVNRFSKSARHVGQTLLLDSSAVAPAAYLGLNDDRTNHPTTYSIHPIVNYLEGLISIVSTTCGDPIIEISGWEE